MHKILFHNKFIIFLYMFRALCSSSGGQNCIIQHLVSSHSVGAMIPDASTCFEHYCAHHQGVKIVLYSIWYYHTCRCDDTRCLYMFRALLKIVLYSIWYYHTCRWPSGAQVERGLTGQRVTIPDAV